MGRGSLQWQSRPNGMPSHASTSARSLSSASVSTRRSRFSVPSLPCAGSAQTVSRKARISSLTPLFSRYIGCSRTSWPDCWRILLPAWPARMVQKDRFTWYLKLLYLYKGGGLTPNQFLPNNFGLLIALVLISAELTLLN